MPVIIEERFPSRETTESENPSIDLLYWIMGTNDDLLAKAQLAAYAPAIYDQLAPQSLHTEQIGNYLWDASVRYGRRKPPETGDSRFAFDTTGGLQHVTQSLRTVNKYAPPGKIAPDFKGAIGVTHDNVEGVDVTIPVYSFSETHYIATATVTSAYKATLYSLTGRVNDAVFRDFNPGEVLFLGAAGSKRGEEDWEISFNFAASPNVTNLTVGDIVGIDKKGWEYLWVRYADAEDNVAKALVKRPVAAYVEEVYWDGDFSGLLI